MTDLVRRAVLKAGQGDVFNLNTSDAMNIVQIPLTLIDSNEENFYTVDDVTELKDSIELIGLKQPLIVLPADGRYRLIAGHRRFKALLELNRETAPCVMQAGLTESEEQLALILTNSTARELTYPEKLEQAKRLKELFIKRREEGAELPGRIRDMVAEAMHESSANIARMEATDKNLSEEWKESLNNGKISAATAYQISKLSTEMQHRLKKEYPVHCELTAKVVQAVEKMEAYPFAPLNCPLHNGSLCTRYAERAEMVANGTCSGCCKNCDHTEGCLALCGMCKKNADREKEREQKAQEEMEAEEQYQKSAYRRVQLSLIDLAQDPRWDDAEQLPYTIKFFRNNTEPRRNSWSPSLADLFELAESMKISLPELVDWYFRSAYVPACISEWHKFPAKKPNEGEKVLCQYGKKSKYDVMFYQNGTFGQILKGEFVLVPFEVHYWTRAFPEVE